MTKTTLALFFAVGVTACSSGHATDPAPAGPQGASTPSAAPVTRPLHARSDLPEGYLHVPNGVAMHGDCIHEVPSGARVHANGDVTLNDVVVDHHEACGHAPQVAPRMGRDGQVTASSHQAPAVGGWIESAWLWAPSGKQIATSTSTFVVPSEPSNKIDPLLNPDGQLLYLFPSISSMNASNTQSIDIVQPVLQWGLTSPSGGVTGVNGSAGGPIGSNTSWTYAAWGVSGAGGAYFSHPITVNSGDTLQAIMSMFAESSTSAWWLVEAIDQTTGASTYAYVEFSTAPGEQWDSAQAGVLEAYYVDLCGDFPASSTIFQYPGLELGPFGTFEGPGLTYAPPTSTGWIPFLTGSTGGYTGPSCGFQTTIAATNLGTTLNY